jgi:hypothetical protein
MRLTWAILASQLVFSSILYSPFTPQALYGLGVDPNAEEREWEAAVGLFLKGMKVR